MHNQTYHSHMFDFDDDELWPKPSLTSLAFRQNDCQKVECQARLQFVCDEVNNLRATLRSAHQTTTTQLADHRDQLRATEFLRSKLQSFDHIPTMSDFQRLSESHSDGQLYL